MLLQNHHCRSRGVARINRLHLAPHLCDRRRMCFYNTSRVILLVFMLSRMFRFTPLFSNITNLLPMRVPAPLFRRVQNQRCIMKMCFWLQPGACLYLRCPLNPSRKHVFVAAFCVCSGRCFCSPFVVCCRCHRNRGRNDFRR